MHGKYRIKGLHSLFTRRWRPLGVLFATALAAIGVIVLSVYAIGTYRYNAALDAVAARGEPASHDDLLDLYGEVAGADNAALKLAPLYDDIVAADDRLYRLGMVTWSVLAEPHKAMSEEDFAKLEAFIQENGPLYDAIDAATESGQARIKQVFYWANRNYIEHLMQIGAVSRVVLARALYEADRGNGPEAASAIRSIVSTANLLAPEPRLLSQLTRISVIESVPFLVERSVDRGIPDPERLGALQEALQDAEHSDALWLALVGERLQRLDEPMNWKWISELPTTIRWALWSASHIPGGTAWLEAEYISVMSELVDAAKLPPWERRQQFERIVQRVEIQSPLHTWRYGTVYAAAVGPLYAHLPSYLDETTAHLRCARLAAALLEYRHEFGGLPDPGEVPPNLAERWPTDPFTGEPLRYELTDNGFLVYSVGPNLTDYGGLRPFQGRWDGGDIVFEVQF